MSHSVYIYGLLAVAYRLRWDMSKYFNIFNFIQGLCLLSFMCPFHSVSDLAVLLLLFCLSLFLVFSFGSMSALRLCSTKIQ